jgi:F0F1-type ATP synthase membrane subunit a
VFFLAPVRSHLSSLSLKMTFFSFLPVIIYHLVSQNATPITFWLNVARSAFKVPSAALIVPTVLAIMIVVLTLVAWIVAIGRVKHRAFRSTDRFNRKVLGVWCVTQLSVLLKRPD